MTVSSVETSEGTEAARLVKEESTISTDSPSTKPKLKRRS